MRSVVRFLALFCGIDPWFDHGVRPAGVAASDPATLWASIALFKSANPDQAGQLASLAINTDQAFATGNLTYIAQAGKLFGTSGVQCH